MQKTRMAIAHLLVNLGDSSGGRDLIASNPVSSPEFNDILEGLRRQKEKLDRCAYQYHELDPRVYLTTMGHFFHTGEVDVHVILRFGSVKSLTDGRQQLAQAFDFFLLGILDVAE